MSLRLLIPLALVAWIGLTLALSHIPALRRPRLARRLAAHTSRPLAARSPDRSMTWSTATDVLAPIAISMGDRLSGLFGTHDRLDLRLRRTDHPMDATDFRLHQLMRASLTAVASIALIAVLPIPAWAAIGVIIAAPLLTFLVIEQSVISGSTRWQQELTAELPVVAEQLGMLLSSGYSLGAAMARVAQRGNGRCSTGFATVVARTRQGLGEIDALREWGRTAEVAALDRLIGTLELNSHSSDLGDLISAEARHTRREVHRALEELIGRREQSVWIPVTVATLVPGVIFMAVPFIDAMGKLTGA